MKRIILISIAFAILLTGAAYTPTAPKKQTHISSRSIPKGTLIAVNQVPAVQVPDMQTLDLRTPCGFTATELESTLKYNLSGLGQAFADAEQEHGVNAVFLIAVAAQESGWGRKPLRRMKYNIFADYGYHPFSYAECIDHVAGLMQANYLTSGGLYFKGYTLSAVNQNWCLNRNGTVKTSWAVEVGAIMEQIYNEIYREREELGK